jgi:hypothetical protein
MPNWVEVKISIKGAKANLDTLWEILDKARSEGKRFCGTFKPLPEILTTFSTGPCKINGETVRIWREVDGINCVIPQDELDSIIKEHGTASWYDWANRHWGVKWDSSLAVEEDDWTPDPKLTRNPRSISLTLQCPWSYPEPIFQYIASTYDVEVNIEISGEWDGPSKMSWTA